MVEFWVKKRKMKLMTEPADIFESQYWYKERKPGTKRPHSVLGLNYFLPLRDEIAEVR